MLTVKSGKYWSGAYKDDSPYPPDIGNGGKWMYFIDKKYSGSVWEKLKTALDAGVLGDRIKISTRHPNPHASASSIDVILVYTYNWQDVSDVKRIREEMRRLGITAKIPYKTNADTLTGKYTVNGDKNFSKYRE